MDRIYEKYETIDKHYNNLLNNYKQNVKINDDIYYDVLKNYKSSVDFNKYLIKELNKYVNYNINKDKYKILDEIIIEYLIRLTKKTNKNDINLLKQNIENGIFNVIIEEYESKYKKEIIELQNIIDLENNGKDKNKTIIENFNSIVKDINNNIYLLNILKKG